MRALVALAVAAVLTCAETPLLALAADGRALPVQGPLPWHDGLAIALSPTLPIPGTLAGGVLLDDGTILRGRVGGLADGVLDLVADVAGPLRLPAAGIAAIVLAPSDLAALPRRCAAGPGAVLANGDRIAGTVAGLDDAVLAIEAAGPRRIPRQRTAVAVLGVPAAAAPGRWALLANGDRRVVADEVPAAGVVAAWRLGGGLAPVDPAEALRSAAADRTGLALPVLHRLLPLPAIRLPANGSIAWSCTGRARLLAFAACPPGAHTAVAAVAVDGRTVWSRRIAAGAPAQAVAIALDGAREVSLLSQAGEGGVVARHAVDWLLPTWVVP